MAFGNFLYKPTSKVSYQQPDKTTQKKLEKLSERQNKPLKNFDDKSARFLDEVFLPQWVREALSFGPKHPVRNRFNEIQFLADIDSFLSERKLNRIPGEKLPFPKRLKQLL